MSLEQLVKDKIGEVKNAFEELKQSNDERLEKLEKRGSVDPLITEKVDKSNEAIDALKGQIEDLKTTLARTQVGDEDYKDNGGASDEYKNNLDGYLRKGKDFTYTWKDAGYKSMSIDSDPDGGYLVSAERSSEIVKRIFESSPMRQLASQISIGSDQLEIMQDLDEMGSGWVSERQARPETSTAKLNMIKIPVEEQYAMPSATQRLLDDASVNLEAWISEKVTEKLIRVENTAFVSGDGSGKPRGILDYPDAADPEVYEFGALATKTATGTANTLDESDDLIEMVYALKAEYLQNATWAMKRATEKVVRKLKDGQGNYLWQPDFATRGAGTILGYPIVQFDDLPAVATGNMPVLFGDFRRGYQIVDRLGIRVLRDPYSSKPFILFYTTKRVGGAVKDYDAIKRLKIN